MADCSRTDCSDGWVHIEQTSGAGTEVPCTNPVHSGTGRSFAQEVSRQSEQIQRRGDPRPSKPGRGKRS